MSRNSGGRGPILDKHQLWLPGGRSRNPVPLAAAPSYHKLTGLQRRMKAAATMPATTSNAPSMYLFDDSHDWEDSSPGLKTKLEAPSSAPAAVARMPWASGKATTGCGNPTCGFSSPAASANSKTAACVVPAE